MNRCGKVSDIGSDDRLIQNEWPSGRIFRREVAVLFQSPHAKTKVNAGQPRLQLGDDVGERCAYDRAVEGEATCIVEQQENIDHVGQCAGRRQCQADCFGVCFSLGKRHFNLCWRDVSDCWIADTCRPQNPIDRFGKRLNEASGHDFADDVSSGFQVDKLVRPVRRCQRCWLGHV